MQPQSRALAALLLASQVLTACGGGAGAPTVTPAMPPAASDSQVVAPLVPASAVSVVIGHARIVLLSFTTSDGAPAGPLTLDPQSLPSDWSVVPQAGACSSVGTAAGCQLQLAYTPRVPGSGTASLAIDYQTGAGTPKRTSVAIAYQAQPSGQALSLLAGTPGGAGNLDGVGAQARFSHPAGLALDGSGALFVADGDNNEIRRIGPDATVTTLAGAGLAGSADGSGAAARFQGPEGIVIDSAGNLYVVDSWNNTIRKLTPAGMVSTFAGAPGVPGSADGAAADARFFFPQQLAIDATGNLFVADTFNSTIRKIAPDGTVTTVAGVALSNGFVDGDAASARFFYPHGVAVDAAGTLYVADTNNRAIRKITPDGTVTTLYGAAPEVPGGADGAGPGLGLPMHLAVDAGGTVYVADYSYEQVVAIAPDGTARVVAGTAVPGVAGGGASSLGLVAPDGLAIDATGTLYVSDVVSDAVFRITAAGVVTVLAGHPNQRVAVDGTGAQAQFAWPMQLALDSAGVAYVSDVNKVRAVTPDGVVTTVWDGSQYYDPKGGYDFYGITVSSAGAIYLTDTTVLRILELTPGGPLTTLPHNGFQYSPTAVAIDAAGVLYLADSGNCSIQKLMPTGDAPMFVGMNGLCHTEDGIGTDAHFRQPAGLALDAAGNLYVADAGDHVVRKVTPAGEATTVAGLAGAAGFADGVGSAARFDHPNGVAVDAAGNLYVADTGNCVIRMIDASGAVSTLVGLPKHCGSLPGELPASLSRPIAVAARPDGQLLILDDTIIVATHPR